MAQRRQFPGKLKARVVLEAIKGETINEIASIYEVHPNQVSKWKKRALELLPEVMDRRPGKKANNDRAEEKLYQQIGKLTVEVDFLKKKLELLQ